MRSDGKQLLATIDNLIDLSQTDARTLRRQTVDIALIARDAVRSAGSAAGERQITVTVTADARITSRAFDNAQNTLVLGGYSVFGFSVRRVLTPRVEVFAAGENLVQSGRLETCTGHGPQHRRDSRQHRGAASKSARHSVGRELRDEH